MPLIKKAWAASNKVSFYSADKNKIVGKHDGAREKVRPALRRDDFVSENVLCQCTTAEHTAAYTDGFQAVKETADMADSPSGGAHASGVGNQVSDLRVAATDVFNRPAPFTEYLQITAPDNQAPAVAKNAHERSGRRAENVNGLKGFPMAALVA
jgi:hypothetical protein